MKPTDIREIIIKKLQKGDAPESLLRLSKKYNISKYKIFSIYKDLLQKNNYSFSISLKKFIDTHQIFWDPVLGSVDITYLRPHGKIQKHYQKILNEGSWGIRKEIGVLLISCILISYCFYVILNSFKEFSWEYFLSTSIIVLLFFGIKYFNYIKDIEINLALLMIVKKNNWGFNPHKNKSHWEYFHIYFSNIFKKEAKNQCMKQEIWGTILNNKKEKSFYYGVHSYEKENESTLNSVFIVPIEKNLTKEFYIKPEESFFYLKRQDIDLESINFNECFHFSYKKENTKDTFEIVKSVTPLVQQEILDLEKNIGKFSLYFQKNCLILISDSELLHSTHTNFFRRTMVDKRDLQKIEKRIFSILESISKISDSFK